MEIKHLPLSSILMSMVLFLAGTSLHVVEGLKSKPLPPNQEMAEDPNAGVCRPCCERGAPGPPGPPGFPGVQGPSGIPGNHGNNGNNGPHGPQGIKGEAGPLGALGPKGSKGNEGSIGLPGKRGQAGASGIPGDPGKAAGGQGTRGPRGQIGPRGLKGEPGDSVAIANGVNGRRAHPMRRWSAFSFGSTKIVTASNHDDMVLHFDHEFANVGGDFDVERSVFTCGVNGTYYFVFHANKWSNSRNLYLKLMKNGDMITSIYEDAGYDYYDGISNSLLLHLVRGDRVWLQLHSNNEVYGGLARMTTFSGWLIMED